MHNTFWNCSDLPNFDSNQFSSIIEYSFQQNWIIYKNRYLLDNDSLQDTFLWILDNSEQVAKQYATGILTLNHGDLHLENILFSNSSADFKIIDWQLSDLKVPAFDVSFFIVQNLTVDQRKATEEDLLQHYYNLLHPNVKDEYSFDRFLLEYRACISRSMLSSIMYIGDRFKHRSDQLLFSDTIAKRVAQAIIDWNPIEAIKELQKLQ